MAAEHYWSVWIGFDPREYAAYAVAERSIRRFNKHIPVRGIVLDDMRKRGLYTRPTERRLGRLFDVISDRAMATEFALSRFLVPQLCQTGLAVVMDCDMLVRTNIAHVLQRFDRSKALACVKHDHRPTGTVKMDGQEQTSYPRKNWSSFMVINCDHPANKRLTLDEFNSRRGLDLHQFCWLNDDEIGDLGVEWNWLVGHSDPNVDPKVVHFTDGVPTMEGFRDVPYADEFFEHLYSSVA